MLSIIGPGSNRTCEGRTRREFLQIGTLGIGGLTLPAFLAAQAHAGTNGGFVRDKAVVILNLQGGPTHIETFDPKMSAPAENRAMFGEVKTNIPGVTFGSHFPQLASMADRLAIVRSFSHGNSSHGDAAALVAAGGNSTKAAMGSLYARLAGSTNATSGIPNNVVLPPKAVGEKYKALGAQTERVIGVGTLSKAYKAFDPSAGSQVLDNMELRISQSRLDDRRALLTQLDRIKRRADATGTLAGADRFQQQAFDVIAGGVGSAFDLSQEDPKLVERYDTGGYGIPKQLLKKKSNVPAQSPIALGKQMLMARRLVEAGCGFITVTSAGWDMHGNAFGIDDGMPLLGPAVDKAASAFLDDLADRGMSDKVLLIITGEFGRTPRINSKGGRDHWGNLCTLLMAGGGLRVGQVIGNSDRTASKPAADPVSVDQLLGTVMHTLFDVGTLRITPGVPGDLNRAVTSVQPIPQLV
ncbi:MAG: hypothetical protein ACI9HK_000003 [Pirellulaceae bacterium]|jgi:uncharacterized protein (DUF1501 family)